MDLNTLTKISYGLYIISSGSGEQFDGCIVNTVFQITSEDPKLAVSINKQNLTHQLIEKSKVFTVSILAFNTPVNFIGQFGFKSGRDLNKFKDVNYTMGTTGAPVVLEHSVAYLEAVVLNSMDVGTHTIFVGRIAGAEILNNEEPLTYDYYHKIKKGTAPKTAPTYIAINGGKEKEAEKMEKYVCTICGYVYDPAQGDPDSGINLGTPFASLPDDWVCPTCGADKSAFEKEN